MERQPDGTFAAEIATIPIPILIDRHGIIVAKRVSLRGPNLEETLEKVFGLDADTR